MSKPLSIDKPVDNNLKPIKDSDGTLTGLEISTNNTRVKNLETTNNLTVKEDLMVSGKLYIDGGGDTYIAENAVDSVRYVVGGDIFLNLRKEGAGGQAADFESTAVGFTQHEPAYGVTTIVYFTEGNKSHVTFGSGNITNLRFIFPDVSCNCTLLLTQDGSGSRTVTNWQTYDFDAGNGSTVKFSGGSNPTLTTAANKTDIISFYWDNDNHLAYGVASLNF